MTRIAIVGFSFMGTTHAQAYKALPSAQLAGIVSPNLHGAKANLERLNLCLPVFSSIKELIASEEVDVIDICTPTDLHATLALEAVAAGKHVFCEKPLALNIGDAERICRAVADRGVFAQVGHCVRFWPEYQALAKLIQSGSAGRLLNLRLNRRGARPPRGTANWLNHEARSGGAALDLHVHDADFILSLFGMPSAVTSVGNKDETGWSHIHTIYHFDGLAVAAEGGWNSPDQWDFQMAFQAVFERAIVEYDCRRDPTLTITGEGEKMTPFRFETPFVGDSVSRLGNISSLRGYYNELAYFIGCIEYNRRPEIATPEQARDAVKLVLLEIESAETCRTVSVQ